MKIRGCFGIINSAIKHMVPGKSGFTALEVVVALVIISIIGALLATYAPSMFAMYNDISMEAEARSMADTIYDVLLDKLGLAKEFVILDGKEHDTILSYKYPKDNSSGYDSDTLNGETFGKTIFPASEFDIEISFNYDTSGRILYAKIKIDDEDGRTINVKEITISSPNAALP